MSTVGEEKRRKKVVLQVYFKLHMMTSSYNLTGPMSTPSRADRQPLQRQWPHTSVQRQSWLILCRITREIWHFLKIYRTFAKVINLE